MRDNAFYVSSWQEAIEALDGDLLLWIDRDGDLDPVEDLFARRFPSAVTEGRVIILGKEMTGAFSHGSLLSLPCALDRLVPMIEAALDGDPATNGDDRQDQDGRRPKALSFAPRMR